VLSAFLVLLALPRRAHFCARANFERKSECALLHRRGCVERSRVWLHATAPLPRVVRQHATPFRGPFHLFAWRPGPDRLRSCLALMLVTLIEELSSWCFFSLTRFWCGATASAKPVPSQGCNLAWRWPYAPHLVTARHRVTPMVESQWPRSCCHQGSSGTPPVRPSRPGHFPN